ncbi:hypothetical protein MTR67_024499 [Solanum verrucosum]|uniref:Uncharacterized protein n=1 Tax=Solanum verrucosum TaxID=315347 RepID=A0AAF0R3Y0_SOLVR|nr:hypothetical protein MTR67_024499 [Solanum verrucosum]
MAPSKKWMQLSLDKRVDQAYLDGVQKFLDYAFLGSGEEDEIRCPCYKCCNTTLGTREMIDTHLKVYGIIQNYTFWYHHGEHLGEPVSNSEDENDDEVEDYESEDEIQELLKDLYPNVDGGDTHTGYDDVVEEEPNVEAKRFYSLLKDLEQPLYQNSKASKLSSLIKLLHIKSMGRWSNASFSMLLKMLKEELLPNGADLPNSYYEAKKIIRDLGLSYDKIDACSNDCMLYWKEDSLLDSCKICGASRWKINTHTGETKNKKGKKIASKTLRYFPLKSRLQRLFMSTKTSSLMTWHKDERTNDGIMRHPADSMAWKSFDDLHPSFAIEPRNVRLGLASDGFQPFRNSKISHSIWPVVLIPYNLPPWLCMKQENFILSMLIPGPNGPGDAIDTYLQPLIEELKELWEVGIETFDASTKQNFKLHASLLWTINDFPAYGNLSGWSTKGKLACPSCNKDTSSIRLANCRKQCFMGHRRYLPKDHRWRNDKKSFDNTIEKRLPPKTCSGIEILNQVQDLEGQPLTKDPKKKRKISHEKRNDNWNKKSIFFELPYWKSLLLRHNLDVMHIEKNICDNIMGTIMNVKGKTKDTINTRLDLEEMNIRPELHPIQRGEKVEVPTACYTLSPEDKHKLCLFLKNLKVPDGFSSNISQSVNLKDHKISGLKSHDCHVLLQHILPLALRGMLSKEVCEPLIELSIFFCVLGSKELMIDDLTHIEAQIPIILCKLEKVFPPSFFDVMVHLPVHLAGEAQIGGPIHYRWMYPIERWLYFLKSLIGNRACPEEFAQNHIDTAQHLSDAEWDREFIEWFKDRVAQLHKADNSQLMEDLLSLSRGPTKYSTHSNGYIVNGYRFHVEDHDQMLRTQNCGVVVVGESDKDSENVDYYGILTDVIELQFISDKRVILFRCNWFDVYDKVKGVKRDEYDFVSVNSSRFLKTNEPFVLANQASQVFYANDNSNKGWHVVRKTQPRDSYEMGKQMDDVVVDLESPSQKKQKRTDEVMFNMKTENVDGSIMKSTIRYSFVAPGTIGKGRGRGLKSLTSKGKDPTRSLFFQSSDLVKQYIQEVETSAIGKGRQQELTNVTMSSSHDKRVIHKKSMALEKGYMQVNASSHPSIKQVKQNVQEVETSSIGKERGIGHKNSTMPSSEVHTPFHSFTNQVKQCTKEVETSAIEKGREQMPRSFCSSLGVSEKNLESSRGLPSMDKKSLVLEKENTEIKSPGSTNQVRQPSQTAETGSSNPKKVRRVRGTNKCKEVASLEAGKKLKVTFYNNRTVGTNSNLFSRHLGKIIRDCNMCPLGVSSWSDIKQQKLDHMWAAIADKFESVDLNDHRDHIFGWMNELWNKWRGYLHATYVKNKPIVQALKNIPKGVEKKEWEWLVKEHFCSESFQARSNRNAENRAKLKMFHHIGSKPIREIIYQQGGKDGNAPNLATIFFETRKKDNMLVEPEAIEKHAQIEEILKAEPSLPSIEIVEKCCGPQNRSHVFGFGGGVKAKDMRDGTSSKAELLSELRSTQEKNKSLNEENKSLLDRLFTLEDAMEEIRNMKEFIAAQQSHNLHMTSPVSTE